MTALGPPGWFTRTDDPKAETPFHYVKGGGDFSDPEPDDKLKGIQGEGRAAMLEWLQWAWISEWDKNLHENATFNDLYGYLKDKIPVKLPTLEAVQGSRNQWEVVVAHDKTLERQLLIRRLDHDTDET